MVQPGRFWLLLTGITAVAVLSLFVWNNFVPASDALSPFTYWCIVAFVVINIFAFYTGVRAVNSKSQYRFIHLMMGLIMLKMVVCIGVVVAHVRLNNPDSKLFILPFLSTYLIFTLFEIYILEKIARRQPKTPQQI